MGVLSTLYGPVLMHKWSVENVVLWCTILGCIVQSVLVLAPLSPIFCVLPILAASGGMCIVAASTALIAERLPKDQGKAQTVMHASIHVALSAGNLLYARLFDAKAVGFWP